MTGLEHMALRPSWDCGSCGKPWPCDPAREALARELDSIQLSFYLWGNYEEAVQDLPRMPVMEGLDRFINWTHRT